MFHIIRNSTCIWIYSRSCHDTCHKVIFYSVFLKCSFRRLGKTGNSNSGYFPRVLFFCSQCAIRWKLRHIHDIFELFVGFILCRFITDLELCIQTTDWRIYYKFLFKKIEHFSTWQWISHENLFLVIICYITLKLYIILFSLFKYIWVSSRSYSHAIDL